jgi:aerobic-type carbon monoxide dehydrogenase small subunit (CoxS/CutS family)
VTAGTGAPGHGRSGRRRRGGKDRERAGGLTRLALTINGERRDVLVAGYKTLLEVLREDLALTGTKHGCELGECGACAVLVDGRPVLSCLRLAVECDGATVTTVEGLADGPALSRLQAAFAERGAAQCGYCTPGILVTAQALLDRNPRPTRAEIAEALAGNLCRCTGYLQILEAVEEAARADARPRGPTKRRGHGGTGARRQGTLEAST